MPELSSQMERELAELEAALAAVVRDVRPEPAPEFVRRLDRNVELGSWHEPRPARGRRWWELLLSGPALGTAAAALLVALVIALPKGGDEEEMAAGGAVATQSSRGESGGGGASASTADSEGAAAAPESFAPRSAAAPPTTPETRPSPASAAESLLTVPPPAGDGSPGTDGRERRKVERSASITLAARPAAIDALGRSVSDLADAQGGFVVSSSVASSLRGGGGSITLRVPVANLEATMAELARLGAVRDRSQRTEDITARSVSARERLQEARAERRSLLRQLEDATTLQATAAIRARLRDVSAQIAAAEADVRRVNNRAAFATVAVTLVADAGARPAGEEDDGVWSPGDAANDALRVLEVIAGVALIALAVLLPLALVVLSFWLTLRWGARRGRERALDAA